MHAARARILAETGRLEEALDETAKALALDPANPYHRNNLAVLLALLRRHAEAVVAWDRLLEVAPEDVDGLLGKAEALLHSGRPAEAKGIVDAALAKAPTNAVAHAVAGAVAKRLGDWDTALPHMEEAARLAPDRADLANNVAWNLVDCPRDDLRDPAKAVVHAERATRLEPAEAGFWNTLGLARLRKGDLEAAVEALRRSADLDHGADPSTGWFLATALARQGKAEEARAALAAPERWWEAHPEGREEMAPYRAPAIEAVGGLK
jgi:tetratricopeptide (TPR) repeat protein